MRTLSGISPAISDMATLDSISTNVVASPIPIPLMAEVVVASVGHIPKTSTKMGFSLMTPLLKFDQ
jgi:hypothetical protein